MATIIKRQLEGENGGIHWRAVVRRGGRTKTRMFRLQEDAEAWARRVESEIERGVWRDTSAADRCTLADALDRYGREVSPTKRANPNREASALNILRDEAGPLLTASLSRITGADMARLRDRWRRDGLAPATIQRRLALLRHLFTVARKEWAMSGLNNPVTDIAIPSAQNERDRRVGDAEITAIKAASASRELPAFIDLAVETAMRRGELVNVKWADINMPARTLHISKTKNGTTRTIPLTPRALGVLRSLPRRIDGKLFAWERPDSATQAFERAVAKARRQYEADCKENGRSLDAGFLVDIRLHDLRHEATSRLAKLLPVHALARVTGHKTLSMLMRYYNPTASELAEQLREALGTVGR